ncbi:MAG: UvrD-helicase domain-containing protein, partial [Bryobacteraceae bacterium]|nr:UvrD-helicase domain-containing protein [Bryobacteraceae bacterium]
MSLTPEQQAAVTRWRQDVCVVAGPGSGKTRVLVERYLWLLDQHQFTPDQILVITFTEKAAQELKERLTHRVAADPVRRATLERAPSSTRRSTSASQLGA